MNISLTIKDNGKKTLSMWFLGQPPKPRVSLYAEESPTATVELDELEQGEVEHILLGIKFGQIEVDQPYETIYAHYQQKFLKAMEQQEQVSKAVNPATVVKPPKSFNFADAKVEEDQKILERCSDIIRQGVRGIKGILATEQSIKVLRKVFELEQADKKRKSVLQFVQDRINRVNNQVIREIEKSAAAPMLMDPSAPYDKIKFEIEETVDQEPVVIKY